MKKIAISQSNYIPWRGYFDLIASVDEFIIFDEMQYTKRDWRNRNKIKTKDGVLWLTVPVRVKGKYFQKIRETKIDGVSWQNNHWKSLKTNYIKAPYFDDLAKDLEQIYCKENHVYISNLNRRLIDLICNYLKIKTKIRDSYEFNLEEDKTERLVNICKELNANEYITGPSAKNYINQDTFTNNNLKLSYLDYSSYIKYNQLWNGFVDNLSILDLIFNCGENSYKYMNYI
jgi:hypothetical protein